MAGAAKLVLSVGGTIRANRNFICMKLDLRNAFNEVSKSSILEALDGEESLAHLASFAGAVLAPDVTLESGGERWGEAEEGVVPQEVHFSVWHNINLS